MTACESRRCTGAAAMKTFKTFFSFFSFIFLSFALLGFTEAAKLSLPPQQAQTGLPPQHANIARAGDPVLPPEQAETRPAGDLGVTVLESEMRTTFGDDSFSIVVPVRSTLSTPVSARLT